METEEKVMKLQIDKCASCGEPHPDAAWTHFSYQARFGLAYWFTCPKTGEPLVLSRSIGAPGVEYGLWSVNDRMWLATNGQIFHTTSIGMAAEQLAVMNAGLLIRLWAIREFGGPVPETQPDSAGVGIIRPS